MASEHRPFLCVLAIGAALRAATMAAYRPMLMRIDDAWGYFGLARDFDADRHFTVAPDRPLGYPLVLSLVGRVTGFDVDVVMVLQHLAGLLTGTLAYAVLVHAGVRRWLAVAAAAVILVDISAIALEHTYMPESWFTLGAVAGAALVALGRSPWTFLLAGVALGASTAFRLVGLVAIPVWLAYLLWRHRHRWRLVAAAVAGLSLPVGGYAAAHAHATGRLGFANASGFFLYARVAHLADCTRMDVPAGAEPLCQPKSERVDNPGIYLWDVCCSPARKMFPGWGATPDEQRAHDRLVGGFARATIRSEPWAYLRLVARDFSWFFVPGAGKWATEEALEPPGSSTTHGTTPLTAEDFRIDARFPAPVLHASWYVLRTPRWLLAPLLLSTLAAMGLAATRAIRRGPRLPTRAAEIALFAGTPLLILLAVAATAQFGLRYVVSLAPLLVVSGALAVEDLSTALHPSGPPPASADGAGAGG